MGTLRNLLPTGFGPRSGLAPACPGPVRVVARLRGGSAEGPGRVRALNAFPVVRTAAGAAGNSAA